MPTTTPSAGPSTRKRRGEGPTRRGEILAAATRIFLQDGIGAATMRRIAAAIGVSPTALYVYFPDKQAILQAIAEATFADLLRTLQTARTGANPADRFRASLAAYVAFGLQNPDAYRLTFLTPPLSMTGGAPCRDIDDADRSFAILHAGVEEMMAANLFAPGPTLPVAEAIWCALHGLTALLMDHQDHLGTPPEPLTSTTLDMIMNGFAPKLSL